MPPKAQSKAKAKGDGAAKKPTKEQTAEIMKVFQAYDSNGDGSISSEELGALLCKLDGGIDQKQVEALMKDINRKGNKGGIDIEDFILWIMSKPKEKDNVEAAAKFTPPPTESGGLDGLLKEIFDCIDENKDGEIERVEMLTAEEARCKGGDLDFGIKERREVVAWFKESGATGTPTDGMFLSREQFGTALKKKAAEGAGVAETAVDQLQAWLEDHYKVLLDEARKPPAPVVAAAEDGMPGPPGSPPPEYPLTIPFDALSARIEEAAKHGKAVLILASELEQIEAYMNYQSTITIDCKALIVKAVFKSEITKEEMSLEGKKQLTSAMNSSGFCKPLWLRLNSSAFDFFKNFSADDFPHELFGGRSMWTIEEAHKRGYFDDNYKTMLGLEEEKKWKQFQVILTSTFDLEKGKEHLADKIPNWDKLAILHVDPKSVA
jgi:Ca2+-binding EF-hand superfamily protein